MPLVVGIDEAGYGPLLGPLVIGASLWRVRPECVQADLWDLLDRSLCRKPTRGEARLPVGDSKKIFDRKRGISTLERTVLAFAHCAGAPCESLGGLLGALGRGADLADDPSPWYRELGRSLPSDPARSACVGIAERLAGEMHEQGATCCALRAEIITETAFNQRLARTRNKAAIVLEPVLRLIQHALDQTPDQDVYVHVDRLGGRGDYRKVLLDAFPGHHLHVLNSDTKCSRYRLATASRDVYVQFVVDGDQLHLPIALASMLAKYLRELLMQGFNEYWRQRDPGLRPTAGYYRDALRFIGEIRPLLGSAGLCEEGFVRQR